MGGEHADVDFLDQLPDAIDVCGIGRSVGFVRHVRAPHVWNSDQHNGGHPLVFPVQRMLSAYAGLLGWRRLTKQAFSRARERRPVTLQPVWSRGVF
jgi:hypothetical protein